MSIDLIDLESFGERLARIRRTYGESIDLPNLGRAVFASLIGISPVAYASYERGKRPRSISWWPYAREWASVWMS